MDMELIHDLRMPVQLIQASAQMLGLVANGGEAREYLEMLLEGVGQLNRLLDGALEAGVRCRPCRVEIVDRMRTLCLRCRDCAEQRGIGLRFTANVAALELVTDPDRLERSVLNLIMNALRFSPPGGAVDVNCAALGDYLEISVSDAGPGIAPERAPYIFLRGETDGGSGYGLPSAMDCARALGGSLSVRSAPGCGSTFTLRLPVHGTMVS